MLHLYNGLVLILIFVGVALRRQRRRHVPIMITAFVLDMASVLYLEFNRQVIAEALEHVSALTMQIHLSFAFLTLAGYGVALLTGRLLLKRRHSFLKGKLFSNGLSVRPVHRFNAIAFLVGRIGIFITSFLVVPH
jgi:hypothetical protein